LEFALVGEGDGVNHEIEAAPLFLRGSKDPVDGAEILHVAGQAEAGLHRFRQRLHALAERLALIGETEHCAFIGEFFCNTPGNRVIVRDSEHKPALAPHDAHRTPILRYASRCLKANVAFVPPKPNEFDRTQPSFALSLRSRTIGMSAKAGSSSSIFALSQMKPLFIIRSA